MGDFLKRFWIRLKERIDLALRLRESHNII
jgi:hypothetical protein